MEIRATIETKNGSLPVYYRDVESWDEIESERVHQGHGYCFCKGKFVLVYNPKSDKWTPPGGGREAGETAEQAVVREVREESNMRVIKQIPLGYQEITEPNKIAIQVRSFCIVEPVGEFVSDPDGDIIEIKLIDPADCKKFFDWGPVGDHLMERSLKLLSKGFRQAD